MLNYIHSTAKRMTWSHVLLRLREKSRVLRTNILSHKMSRNPVSSRLNHAQWSEESGLGGCSRAAKMIQIAVGADAVVSQKPRGKRYRKKPHRAMDPNFNPKNSGQKTLNAQLAVEALNSLFAIEASTFLSSNQKG